MQFPKIPHAYICPGMTTLKGTIAAAFSGNQSLQKELHIRGVFAGMRLDFFSAFDHQ